MPKLQIKRADYKQNWQEGKKGRVMEKAQGTGPWTNHLIKMSEFQSPNL